MKKANLGWLVACLLLVAAAVVPIQSNFFTSPNYTGTTASTARTYLGLGSAATNASGVFLNVTNPQLIVGPIYSGVAGVTNFSVSTNGIVQGSISQFGEHNGSRMFAGQPPNGVSVPLIVSKRSDQVTNMVELHNSSGITLSGVDSNGSFFGTGNRFTNTSLVNPTLTGTITADGLIASSAGHGTNTGLETPALTFPTNYGVLVMRTNAGSTNQSYIEFPNGTHSGLYWPGGQFAMFGQYDHLGSPFSLELGIVSYGDIALATGIGVAGGKIQMGGSGFPGTYTQIQYSGDMSSFLTWRGYDFDALAFRDAGVRLETTNRNGNTMLRFYNPLPDIGSYPNFWTGGRSQFGILTNGVELNYRFTRQLTNHSGATLTMDFKGNGRVVSHPTASTTILLAPISEFTNMNTELQLSLYPDFGDVAISFPANNGPTNIIWRSESGIAVAPTNLVGSNALYIHADLEVSTVTNVIFQYSIGPYSPVVDANAASFFTASGVTDASIKGAINQFCVSAKSHGYFTKLIAMWPFVGGTSNTASWNLVDTNKYRIGWTGSFTFNANSVAGDGSTAYATATGLIPSTELASQNDTFASTWVKSTAPNVGGYYFAIVGANNSRWGMGQGSGIIVNSGMNANVNNEFTGSSAGDSSGLSGQNRTGSTTEQDYIKSGASGGTTGRTATIGLPTTTPFTMYARRFSDLSRDSYSNVELSGAAVGQTMTSQNITDLIADWAALNTALGR